MQGICIRHRPQTVLSGGFVSVNRVSGREWSDGGEEAEEVRLFPSTF